MATIILSAVGAAVGGSIGGSVLGLSSVAIGRLAGATLGRVIDQRLLGQGADVVETGQVDRFRLTGAGEGDPVARVYGRMRVSGQVIWASAFEEIVSTSGGGKGGSLKPKTRSYAYQVSLAIALCEGEISGIGRIWADGAEIAQDLTAIRVYHGGQDQLPDPKIEAVEGAGLVPAYRGTAYVVLEDLALEAFGNRVPQFSFEVIRPAPVDTADGAATPAQAIRAVAMMPGSGEYTLATTPVSFDLGAGKVRMANVNTASGKADFVTALDQLEASLPHCDSVSLIVSWFGDDLRCGACDIRPKVEQAEADGNAMPWQVAGLTRATATLVGRDPDDRPIFGGTPADAAVIESIAAMQARDKRVMFYPFLLMEQMAGNALPDPYSEAESQPALPWRGRISLSVAPGQPGSPDGSAAAASEVADFFGTAAAADFSITEGAVSYSGPPEWRYRRFILHCAALCAAAGGVDAFCIGSEMRGLTQVRGAANTFPVVAALKALAAEVRALLPEAKIGYAADWSEYFGYHPQDGSGDVFYHLDPLWADANIDFVGIDNYMPLSDWREGDDHADADWGSIYDPDYLAANIEGGEGYDWFYHSPEAEAAQIRSPISDGAYGEAWVYRYKDIRNWWLNDHHDRISGIRQELPSEWVPQSKPIWFTELGCAAVDKGTNQPNRFLDPKSSESALPKFSTGRRDDVIQQRYLEVMHRYWSDPAHNPVSLEYAGAMVDMSRAHVWAWDARPFPAFPNADEVWSDGANWRAGHWISGRVCGRPLASVVAEICRAAGLVDFDVSDLVGHVSGYVQDDTGTARAGLQPLMLRYGFDAVERDGLLRFVMRTGRVAAALGEDDLAVTDDLSGRVEETRAPEAELAGRVRLRFVQAEADFAIVAEEAVMPDEGSHGVSASELSLAMTRGEGRQVVERWLTEARLARDTVRIALPPSRRDLGAGDVVQLPVADGAGLFRVDRVEQGAHQMIEAVRIEPGTYRPVDIAEDRIALAKFVPPVPILPLFLDLPLMRGDEVPHAPHLAVTGDPWPGTVALYSSDADAGYVLNSEITRRATIGVTQSALSAAPPGLIDRGAGVSVRLTSGALSSISDDALLAGGNLLAIGDGTSGHWELLQFRDAVLTGPQTWLLSHRLRGQLGSDALMPSVWPVGSWVVLLDGGPTQIALSPAQRRQARHYRSGPAQRPYDDPSYRHDILAFDGIGLRPFAPTHLTGVWSGGDLGLSWIRRSRIEGDSWDGLEVPLGEERELYLLRILQGGTLLREEQSEAPVWTYTEATQTADGLAPGLFEVQVAQVSAVFGPGLFRVLTLSA
ncbi:glycoside hydrolase/phage tail family protein [Pseudooceanicola sp.]|uniref:baseplate multidomain protein megatron n=1 Tax=Pseudooceanicola sp. TaxID=1914328 RepID=UPI002627687A|nr:glycoside hydrolase/phage tail family protein [Pseudooceanicola sp.]MDF1854913.1 glycoside hydrolase/phage tail family protein [Pseudooceanicola sp.]